MKPIPKPKTFYNYQQIHGKQPRSEFEDVMVERLLQAANMINENNRAIQYDIDAHQQIQLILNQTLNNRIEYNHEVPNILDRFLGGGIVFANIADVYGSINLPADRIRLIDDDVSDNHNFFDD